MKYIRGKTLVGLSVSKYDINIELLYSVNIRKTVSARENNAYAGNASFKENIPEKEQFISHYTRKLLYIILHFSTRWSHLLLTEQAPSKRNAVVSPYVTIWSKV